MVTYIEIIDTIFLQKTLIEVQSRTPRRVVLGLNLYKFLEDNYNLYYGTTGLKGPEKVLGLPITIDRDNPWLLGVYGDFEQEFTLEEINNGK